VHGFDLRSAREGRTLRAVRLRLPHPFVLLLGGVVVATALTWILPAGEYTRQMDPTLGREVVVAGTYAKVAPAPVGLMGMLLAVPKGAIAGADVILTILFCGGAFALLDSTGALSRLVGAAVGRTKNPNVAVIVMSIVFAAFGAMENMHEEFIALMPVLVLFSRGLGFGAITAMSMSVGAAMVGAAFGPTNPFATGIALRFAGLPAMSEVGLRMAVFGVALAVWIAWTLWSTKHDDVGPEMGRTAIEPATGRDVLLLALCVAPILTYVVGVLTLDWGFNELTALFLVAGFAVGLVAGYGLTKTSTEFLKGMESMLAAGLFVGVARGMSVVLSDGRVLDTIVAGIVAPLSQIPATAAAILMVPAHTIIHIVVTSNSGQAVLTMPIMAPTADLLGISRDAAVMAYQAGAPTTDVLIPTNGALLAMLYKAGVPYARWLRFAVPGVLMMMAVGVVGVILLR
jgi:uncharacterized ion transporter superfamily protein YfcC